MKYRLALIVLALASVSLSARAQGWDWKVVPYLWGPGIDGHVALGPISRPVDLAFSDLLDVLAGAALVHVEGRDDANGFFADATWMSLEPEDEVATAGGVAKAQFNAAIVETGYLRRLSNVSLELGVRYWDFEIEIDPAQLAAAKRHDGWTDLFVGARYESSLSDTWKMTAEGNIGGGASQFTYGVQLVFARKLRSGNAFVTGLKALSVDYHNKSVGGVPFELDTLFVGAIVGYSFD